MLASSAWTVLHLIAVLGISGYSAGYERQRVREPGTQCSLRG